jgi:hypothetical protein
VASDSLGSHLRRRAIPSPHIELYAVRNWISAHP